jgi:hypothetical protein
MEETCVERKLAGGVMKLIKSVMARILNAAFFSVHDKVNKLNMDIHNSQIAQRQLFFYYQALKSQGLPLPRFYDTGFRVYSQNDEDGLLLYIFSLIGFTNKICVDMAFGSPYGANTTNLICNWGFHGLLVEGGSVPTSFFKTHKDTSIFPPKLVRAWITAENVNELCVKNGIKGEIDFFSLDMDGVDYWVWKNLEAVSPRVMVVEYLDILGHEKALTVPYKPDFNRFDVHEDFFSASLPAFVKLGKEKGYRLVGVNKYGFNAFFIKNGLGEEVLPEIKASECFTHPKVKSGIKERYPAVKDLPWVEV